MSTPHLGSRRRVARASWTLVAAAIPAAVIAVATGCRSSENHASENHASENHATESGASARVEVKRVTALSPEAAAFALRMSPVPDPPLDTTNRVDGNDRAAEFGRHLFHSSALSNAGTISCATCHDVRDSFTDGDPLATGVLPLERHTPTLWNVAHQRWFFWDGRADSLWAQALVPLEDPLEHAFTRVGVARAVHADPVLRGLYEKVFGEMPSFADADRFPAEARPVPENDRAHELADQHAREARAKGSDFAEGHRHLFGSGFYHPHQRAWDGMTAADQDLATEAFVNVGKSLAAFQRRLHSTRAPFDVFVEGLRTGDVSKLDALDESARRGFELFVGRGQCAVCHHGPLLTDYEFHNTQIPVMEGAPADDPGRARGLASLQASEFGVGSRWSDDPNGPARVKVDFLPQHVHGGSPEFKTPTLRNVALTAPYMHNGVFETLEDVLDFYSTRANARTESGQSERILQPFDLTEVERTDLIAFLESLTDDSLDLERVRAPR